MEGNCEVAVQDETHPKTAIRQDNAGKAVHEHAN